MSRVLYDDIAGVAAALPGRLGVAVRFVESGEEVLYCADDIFPSASVIKVAILAAVYRDSP
jgi:beta-lactamase class A